MLPKHPPILLCFRKRRRRTRFGGLRQSVPARLLVEPLGFQSMPGQTRGAFNRVICQAIRLPLEALEFGDMAGERGLWRSLGRLEYRSVQRPPRRLAARSRLHDAVRRGQRTTSRKLRKAPSRFVDLLLDPFPRSCALTHGARSRLERVGELSKILGARHGQPGERFEVDNRRIEPRGGVCELKRVLCQRDSIVSNAARQLGDLAESGIFFSQRRGIMVTALRLLAQCARRPETSALARVEQPWRLPTPPRRAPP